MFLCLKIVIHILFDTILYNLGLKVVKNKW